MKIILKEKGLSLEGTPCISVKFAEEGEEMTLDGVLTKVLEAPLKNVWVHGNLSKEVEIKTIVNGLAQKGKIVVFVTNIKEDIGPVRLARGVKIILTGKDSKIEKIGVDTMSLLKENDEVIFGVSSKEGYNAIREFLKIKNVAKPLVSFKAKPEVLETFLQEYLDTASTYLCRTRIL